MNRTKIPWCDWTWNPIVGCSPASEGCANCYAAGIARRFGYPWGKAVLKEERLNEPMQVKKPGRVFVCSMSDLWHESVREEWRGLVESAMRGAPWHTYILLTKRPEHIGRGRTWPRNWWIGVSAENQEQYEKRWTVLTELVHGAERPVRFVSVEPMLGPVQVRDLCLPDWVIAGPETGAKARRFEDSWIDAEYEGIGLGEQCLRAGIPFFDKREKWTRRERLPLMGLASRSLAYAGEERENGAAADRQEEAR